MVRDVAVVGGGPTALALAASLGEQGVRVRVVGGPDVPWQANYGLWVDEMEALGLEGFLGPVWTETEVVYLDGERRALGRAYGRLARGRFRAHLLERCAAAGVTLGWQRATEARHDATGSVVSLDDGEEVRVALVIDASGHRPALVERSGEPTAFQAALGLLGTVPGHAWSTDRMTFMDLRQPPRVDALADVDATFLYAMPIANRRLFVEETSLVRTPAMPWSTLRRRLHARLAAAGVRFEQVETTELCLIPMDTPLPRLDQRVVGFGAAASLVHPATGYLLARSLREAPALARLVAEGLGAGQAPSRVAHDAWRSVWTEERLFARQLYLYGSRIVAGLGPADTSAFFRTFFSLPDSSWRAYLAGDRDLSTVAAAMVQVFGRSDARQRWLLARAGHRLPGALLRRASA